MEPVRASINTDLWAHTISKLRPGFKRRQNSMQITFIRSKSRLERLKSRVSLLQDEKHHAETTITFPFLTFPLKVRRKIYAALFNLMIPTLLIVRDPVYLTFYPEDTFPRILPGLCYASRQVYNESIAMMLKNRHVILPDLMACKILFDFLSRLTNIPFTSGIRSLLFGSHVNWQPFATHTVQKLLRRCSNIRHIKVEVTPSACVQYDFEGSADGGGFSPRLKKHVVEQIDLCCLLSCRKLETITLVCVESEAYAVRMGFRVDAIFAPLVSWVQQNICGTGSLRLVVEYELWGKSFTIG